MKVRYLVSTLLIGLTGASAANAGGTPSATRRVDRCFVPFAEWQPRTAILTLAEEKGWMVRRIKTDEGCYEVKGWDSTGRALEILLDPRTLETVKIDYDEDENDWLKKDTSGDN